MSSIPGTSHWLGYVPDLSPEQLADARTYIARHEFDDEADILDALGLA